MKSKITIRNPTAEPFPNLFIWEDKHKNEGSFVVLMSDDKSGMVVQSTNKIRPVGQYFTCWDITDMKPFHGVIKLISD